MKRSQLVLLILVVVLTIANLLLSVFNPVIYGYFNQHGQLGAFLTGATLFRLFTYAVILISGFWQLRDNRKGLTGMYLVFFLFNLVIATAFAL